MDSRYFYESVTLGVGSVGAVMNEKALKEYGITDDKLKGSGWIFKNLKKYKSNCCDTNLFFFVFIVVTIFMIVDKTIS